jgi:hypothetical protein
LEQKRGGNDALDYLNFDDQGQGMKRLTQFVSRAAMQSGAVFKPIDDTRWQWKAPKGEAAEFTSDRDLAVQDENLHLLGLEHPIVKKLLGAYAALPAGRRFLAGKLDGMSDSGLLTIWKIETHGKNGQPAFYIVRLGINNQGERAPWLEKMRDEIVTIQPDRDAFTLWQGQAALRKGIIQDLLQRELRYSGIIDDEVAYSAIPLAIIGCILGLHDLV